MPSKKHIGVIQYYLETNDKKEYILKQIYMCIYVQIHICQAEKHHHASMSELTNS